MSSADLCGANSVTVWVGMCEKCCSGAACTVEFGETWTFGYLDVFCLNSMDLKLHVLYIKSCNCMSVSVGGVCVWGFL